MCNACLPTPANTKQSDAFADQMLEMLNQGALALMVSIGHRTGLFDAMAELPPAPIGQISAHTGLHRRYVEEWLAAMVAGGIVDYSAEKGEYQLTRELVEQHHPKDCLALWLPELSDFHCSLTGRR